MRWMTRRAISARSYTEGLQRCFLSHNRIDSAAALTPLRRASRLAELSTAGAYTRPTSRLNASAMCGIGLAFRACLGGVWEV